MNLSFGKWKVGLLLSITLSGISFASSVVPVLRIHDSLNLGTLEYVQRGLREAERDQAPALLLELDTPGGYLESTRELVQLFLASPLPILVWVTPAGAHAASAGAMITLAAHYAAMSESTSIGAATPISMGGEMTDDLKRKIHNDTLSFVRGIAEKRGRNVSWAEKSVTEAASLNASEALQQKVIDGIHSNREAVYQGARIKYPELPATITFQENPPHLKESLLSFFSNPNVAYGLMALGGLGLYLEMSHPGTLVPGTLGVVSLVLGAMTMNIVPIRPGAFLLLLVGMALLAIEVLTTLPTYGLAGVFGVVALFLSGVFLLDPAQTNLSLSAQFWIPIFVAVVAFIVFIGVQAGRALRAGNYPQGLEGLLGLSAEVHTALSPDKARLSIHGELWNARWSPQASGEEPDFRRHARVRIVAQKGLTLYVEPEKN